MGDTEVKVQKYVVQVCKFLPQFVDQWKEFLADVKKPIRGLVNLSEQLRSVERVRKPDEEDFFEMQQGVLFSIYEGIEEELATIKNAVEKMNGLNGDLKNKLSALETASLMLDWDNRDSSLIRGSAVQPSLRMLLDLSLDFLVFFISAGKNIHGSFKGMDVRDEKLMKKLEESFDVDPEDTAVTSLLAITQYVENEKALV